MEEVLHAVGKDMARRERRAKRARDSADAAPSTASSDPTEPSWTDEDTRLIASTKVHDRLYGAIVATIEKKAAATHSSAGETLLCRMICAVFMAVHAIKEYPLGVKWGALLYVSSFLVYGAFTDNGDGFKNVNLKSSGMYDACVALGMERRGALAEEDDSSESLKKAARGWTRLSDSALTHAMMEVWDDVSNDKRVRLTVESLLWPCKRAYTLFEGRH